MSSMNKVLIMGNLGKDPEIRQTAQHKSVCNLNIATSEKWTDVMGETREVTEWHRVIVWGKSAENCGKYLKKGSKCFVEGRLQTRKYKKDGVDSYATEIVANQVIFVSFPSKGEEAPPPEAEAISDPMVDIPF